jgi:tetratricopeptide (TPR) repeat protein
VFLDIETTGLVPGPATLVVVVGLAFLRDRDCIVRQYILDEPGAERDLLASVTAELGSRDTLVTFNGKSFDVPMLAGRFRLHRLPDPMPPVHLDLLHPSRRIWGRRLRRSNLSTLEARLLGIARIDDVPGAEIPRRYFDFVRDKRWDAFAPVVEHNRQDLVSLARLALRLELLLMGERERLRPAPSDLLGLGALHERTGRVETARRCYEEALASTSSADRVQALHRLAGLSHRSDEVDRAVELYDAVSRFHCREALVAAIELAKLHEHRTGAPRRALGYAQRARDLLRSPGIDAPPTIHCDVERRIARLERKFGVSPPE